jgi:hypothetical protein
MLRIFGRHCKSYPERQTKKQARGSGGIPQELLGLRSDSSRSVWISYPPKPVFPKKRPDLVVDEGGGGF